mmetsp:Transcript_6615/g.9157  ORF Transcript_6615/g.9157 Transcript_6615/m.9157 type:complete len:99 (-) Transcript_6615:466-762(-)
MVVFIHPSAAQLILSCLTQEDGTEYLPTQSATFHHRNRALLANDACDGGRAACGRAGWELSWSSQLSRTVDTAISPSLTRRKFVSTRKTRPMRGLVTR